MVSISIADERLHWWTPQPAQARGDTMRLDRFPRDATKLLHNQIGPLANLRSAPGCGLLFTTDAPWIGVRLARLRHHQPVDQSIELSVDHPGGRLATSARISDHEGERELRLATGLTPGAPTTCSLWWPTISTFVIAGLELPAGSSLTPAAAPAPRWLAIGDSGTQGFVVDHPRDSWVHRLSERWQLPVWNLGIGGLRIEPELYDWALETRDWDLITVGLGANHAWNDTDVATVGANAQALAEKLSGRAQRCAWLIPGWKAAEDGKGPPDFMGVPLHGAAVTRMTAIRDTLRQVLGDFDFIQIIEDMIPHDDRLLPDGLHPTAKGSALIAERFAERIAPALTDQGD